MDKKSLGNTDYYVSEACLGTMYFGTKVAKENAFRVLDCYIDHGGNFIDTANNYAYWVGGTGDESELLLGQWMKERGNRNNVVLSSKVGARPDVNPSNQFKLEGLSKKTIIKGVENSLRRLKCSYLDLCYLHVDLLEYPLHERLEALYILKKDGKIVSKGCSNIRSDRYVESEELNEKNGWSAFSAVQQKFSYLLPEKIDPEALLKFVDQPLIQECEKRNAALLTYSVLLLGAYEKGFEALPEEYQSSENRNKYAQISEEASEYGWTPSQWVLNWVRNQSKQIIPIIAASSTKQLEENLQIWH